MSLTYADLFKYVVKKEDNKEPLSEFQEYYTMIQQNMHSKDYEKEQYLNMQLTILSRDKKYPTALPPDSSMYDYVKSSRLLADRAQNITLLAYHNADFHILIRHMLTNWNEYDSVFRLYPDWLPPPYLVPLDCFVTVTQQDTEQALKRRERILNKEIQKAIETIRKVQQMVSDLNQQPMLINQEQFAQQILEKRKKQRLKENKSQLHK